MRRKRSKRRRRRMSRNRNSLRLLNLQKHQALV